MKDQIAIWAFDPKNGYKAKQALKISQLFWLKLGHPDKRERKEEKRRKEEEKKKGRRRRRRKKEKIKVWKSMDFCMEKSNHKPIFLMNLGLKEPYLVYWWCLAVLD